MRNQNKQFSVEKKHIYATGIALGIGAAAVFGSSHNHESTPIAESTPSATVEVTGEIDAVTETKLISLQSELDGDTTLSGDNPTIAHDGASMYTHKVTFDQGGNIIDNALEKYRTTHNLTDISAIPVSVKESINVTANDYEKRRALGGPVDPLQKDESIYITDLNLDGIDRTIVSNRPVIETVMDNDEKITVDFN